MNTAKKLMLGMLRGSGAAFSPLDIAGLALWLSPETLSAYADNTAITAWVDQSSTFAPVPDSGATQPTCQTNEINGLSVVRFDGGDRFFDLTSREVSTAFTMFLVYKPTLTGTNQTLLMLGASTNGLQVRQTSANKVAALKAGVGNIATGTSVLDDGAWVIVRITYDGSHGEIWLNGILDGSTDAARTFDAGGLAVGSRYTSEMVTSDYAEVSYYNRVLTSGELAQVESYLAAKYALTLRLLHVHSVSGNDSNGGATIASPLKTLTAAFAALSTVGGQVNVVAAEASPLREEVVHSGAGEIVVTGESGGTWYHYGSEVFTSGWTDAGGGIYSRSITGYPSTLYLVVVTSIVDGDGIQTKLVRNASTPTTPGASEFGVNSGALYVHLPADASANSHTIEAAKWSVCIGTWGIGRLTLRAGVFRYANSGNIMVGDNAAGRSGRLTAEDCTAEYSGSTGGFFSLGDAEDLLLTSCISKYADNDGYNVHANTGRAVNVVLTDCEAAYNEDEGVSPHDDTRLTIVGGTYHHSGHAGLAAINRAFLNVYGATFRDNGILAAGTGIEQGHGVAMTDEVTGTVETCLMENNVASGIYNITSPNGMLFSGNTSGVAAGNGDDDVGV